VAQALAEAVRACGCSALNLRLDVSTRDPSQVAGQVEVLGAEVLPRVRDALGRHDGPHDGPAAAPTHDRQPSSTRDEG
jgi:hypothetical protein